MINTAALAYAAVIFLTSPFVLLGCDIEKSTAQPLKKSAANDHCTVLKVIDGDTLKVRLSNFKVERVRLLRVNTPEKNQLRHKDATGALTRLLKNKQVELSFEHGVKHRDKYGRLLAYVYADGVNVNIEMVQQGWTRFYKLYGGGKFARAFELAERKARRAKRGLWADK